MTASPVNFRITPQALYAPTYEETQRLFERGDLVPVYRALQADLETPVSVYLKLARDSEPSFLLESVEGGEQVARYSFLGVNPHRILTLHGHETYDRQGNSVNVTPLEPGKDPMSVIRDTLYAARPVTIPGLPRFVGGAVGYMSYDIARYFERLPNTARDEINLPDAAFMIADTLVIFDHVKHRLIVLSNARNEGDPRAAYDAAIARIEAIVERLRAPLPEMRSPAPAEDTGPMLSNMTQAEYEASVRQAKEYIAAGDAFQIVISQRLTRETSADPFSIYRTLRMLNPSPYMFYLNFPADDVRVIGASPEMLARFDAETRTATVRPIAGTAPRGIDTESDLHYEKELLADPKERAEHVMLVDLGRNDLGRVCEYGSVHVPALMIIERFSHVMHITSHVEGKLRPELDAFDLLRATFPAGTLSGAPKIRAMEIIEELEGTRRGLYGGGVGYFSYGGSMDVCIAIRTLVMRGRRIYLQAGAGIVADSEPTKEYQETLNKARATAVAIDNAERGLFAH